MLILQGASAELWKGYLPNAEIWFAEYDVACVQRHADKLKEIGVHVVTGDQGDNATLARWLQETGGGFDVIVVSSSCLPSGDGGGLLGVSHGAGGWGWRRWGCHFYATLAPGGCMRQEVALMALW